MSRDYRSFVGPRDLFDVVGATQFNVLTNLGLREHHFLLDIGCGSLRAGRLFIPYLLPGHYFGSEPNRWLVEEAIKNEIGQSLMAIKQPVFMFDGGFNIGQFGRRFDFILAQSIFTHASQSQIKKCLSEAKRAMHDSSIFVATYDKGRSDYAGEDWVYPGYVTYTPETMGRLIEEQGLSFEFLKLSWSFSDRHTWMAITTTGKLDRVRKLAEPLERESLEKELEFYKTRYSKLLQRPYVKLGKRAGRIVHGTLSKVRPRRRGKPKN